MEKSKMKEEQCNCANCTVVKECCCHKGTYPSHVDEISRLNRVAGQIEGIKKMIQEQRYCLDIMTQITAARSALKSIECHILKRHLNSCVMKAMNDQEKCSKVQEILDLFKREGN